MAKGISLRTIAHMVKLFMVVGEAFPELKSPVLSSETANRENEAAWVVK